MKDYFPELLIAFMLGTFIVGASMDYVRNSKAKYRSDLIKCATTSEVIILKKLENKIAQSEGENK